MDTIQKVLEMCKYIQWTNVKDLEEYKNMEKRKKDDVILGDD